MLLQPQFTSYRVLAQLGLEQVADTRIGSGERRGISGGEMRRVSLGCELVVGCDVVVLDEPTSGQFNSSGIFSSFIDFNIRFGLSICCQSRLCSS